MATEFTEDAVIDTGNLPPNQQANLNVISTPFGTQIASTGPISGLQTQVVGGVQFQGGQFLNNNIAYLDPNATPSANLFALANPGSSVERTVLVQQTTFSNAVLQGSALADTLVIGGSVLPSAETSVNAGRRPTPGPGPRPRPGQTTNTVQTTASFGDGADSISFLTSSSDRNSSYNMGNGSDSVVFGSGATSNNSIVNLGAADGQTDSVIIEDGARVSRLVIGEFGQEDVLKVGGKTYTYDEIQSLNGRVSPNIRVILD